MSTGTEPNKRGAATSPPGDELPGAQGGTASQVPHFGDDTKIVSSYHGNRTELEPTLALITVQGEMLDLYHRAYAAHHGENGPIGCPCCAEFMPEIAEVTARLEAAIDAWAGAARV